MKKSHSIFCAMLTASMITAPAYAASPYVGSNFGGTWFNNSGPAASDQTIVAGLNVTGAIGMTFDNFRLEAEVGGQSNIDPLISGIFGISSSMSVTSLLVNGYYDIKGGDLEPYLTIGVGPTWVDIDNSNLLKQYSAKYTTLGYQVGAGVAIPLGNHFAIDARYRYFGTGTITDNTNGNLKIASHSALFGLRYEF